MSGFQKFSRPNSDADIRSFYAGGSRAFGPLRIYLGYNHATHSEDLFNNDAFTASVAYTVSPKVMLSAGYGYVRDSSDYDRDAQQFGLMLWYYLNKDTTLYASSGYLDNMSNGVYTMNGATTIGVPAAYPGATIRGVQFGAQYRF